MDNLENIIRKDIEENALFQIKKAIKKFGIEGTEEKIKSLYSLMPKMKDILLDAYYKILNSNNKKK